MKGRKFAHIDQFGRFVRDVEITPEMQAMRDENVKAMVKAKKAPGLKGDDTKFLAAFKTIGDTYDKEEAEHLVSEAKKHGYNPSASDVYMPTVARFRGDPEAFFHGGRGRADLKKTIDKNFGTESSGWVDTKANNDRPVIEEAPLAQDIVDNLYKKAVHENPDMAKNPGETKYNLRKKHDRKFKG